MLLESVGAVFGTLIVLIAAFGVGVLLLPCLPNSVPHFHRYVYAWIAGFGLLGVLLFVIGQWRFTRTIVIIVLVVAVFSAILHIFRSRDFFVGFSPAIPRAAYLPAAIVAIVLVITTVGSFTKPVGDWGIDGVAYHLTGSKVWLRDRILRPIPDNAPTSYPCTVEVVYAALTAVGGDLAPGLSAVFTMSLFLLSAGLLGSRCGLDKVSAWWVAGLLAAMPAVYEGGHSAFIDVVYATFVLAAARIGLDAETPLEFAGFGIFCGLMMATKYPALVAVPMLLLCALWPRSREYDSGRKTARMSAYAALGTACLVAIPFYLRNWILLGSPVYPPPTAVASILHVKYYPAKALRAFYQFNARRTSGHGRGLIEFLLLPFNFTYHTADFNGAGGIGLVPIALGPIGIIGARFNWFTRRLAVLALLLTVAWFVTLQDSRYFYHVVSIITVFGVIGWRRVLTVNRRSALSYALCAAVIACSVLYGLFMISKARSSDIHAALSPAFAEERRKSEIPFVQSMDFVNSDPSVTRLLVLDRSVVAYYLNKDYVKPFGQWGEQVFPDAPNSAAVLKRLPSLGVSHVLDVDSVAGGFQVPRNYPGLELIFTAQNQRVYRVVTATPGASVASNPRDN